MSEGEGDDMRCPGQLLCPRDQGSSCEERVGLMAADAR
jgi:hypothetical protein